ncbi:hypothetical protein MJO29_010934 [Puccinia striiformis f. sp. tritici]|nr:hypothetical protein MJO29_010934 [Puccinia striiformis f. sp. tritici]
MVAELWAICLISGYKRIGTLALAGRQPLRTLRKRLWWRSVRKRLRWRRGKTKTVNGKTIEYVQGAFTKTIEVQERRKTIEVQERRKTGTVEARRAGSVNGRPIQQAN